MSDSATSRRSKRSRAPPKKADSPEPHTKKKRQAPQKKVAPTQPKPKPKPKPKAKKVSKKQSAIDAKLQGLISSGGIMSIFTSSSKVQGMTGEVSPQNLCFGPNACQSIDRESGSDEKLLAMSRSPHPHTLNSVRTLVVASYPGAASMRGQRNQRQVTEMMYAWTNGGLFTMNQATNDLVAPASKYIFSEMEKLPASDPKRVAILETLADACIDCQQVQAREVMRFFSDLTNQSVTFEHQILYFLSKKKDDALQRLITTFHDGCDKDWTQVQPYQQRPHLVSAYVNLLTENFGLPGVVTARADRFMREATNQLVFKDREELKMNLMQMIDIKEFTEELLSDINNQVEGMDHLISQKCIFDWVTKHKDVLDPHTVFYDDARADEFKDQEPKKPKDENEYEPFLSRFRLQQILLVMGVLAIKD